MANRAELMHMDPNTRIVRLNVGGAQYAASLATLLYEEGSLLHQWFWKCPDPPLPHDNNGAYFIDRDPNSFNIILNYLRLKKDGQVWEACLPKDPDRLALLTQEAEYFKLLGLRDQAVHLLHCCTERCDMDYVNAVMVESQSCPQGFSELLRSTNKTLDDTDQYKKNRNNHHKIAYN